MSFSFETCISKNDILFFLAKVRVALIRGVFRTLMKFPGRGFFEKYLTTRSFEMII